MKYGEFINQQMLDFANIPNSIFLGYNIINGSQGYGSFKGVPKSKLIEMPCAEASMAGIATGLALAGFLPILFFERQDFMLLASDQIINHLAKTYELSHGKFRPKVIIRAIVGSTKPFHPGPQHLGYYSPIFMGRGRLDVLEGYKNTLPLAYAKARASEDSSIIVEYKELYCEDLPK